MVADPNEADAVFTGAVVNFTAVPNDLRSRVRPRAAADNLRLAAENAIEVARGL